MPKELKFIIPPISNCMYLTAGKKYPVVRIIRKETLIKSACVIIEDDSGAEITTELRESAHLYGKSFSKIYE